MDQITHVGEGYLALREDLHHLTRWCSLLRGKHGNEELSAVESAEPDQKLSPGCRLFTDGIIPQLRLLIFEVLLIHFLICILHGILIDMFLDFELAGHTFIYSSVWIALCLGQAFHDLEGLCLHLFLLGISIDHLV